MGIANVGSLTLGQYGAICRQWNKAHGQVTAPSEDELDLAVARARGLH